MTINWMPEHFNQRRPKTSYLLGQAIGESLGKASDMYLKGKMENYFQNQKDERASKIEQAASERSAGGYEKLTGIKGLKEHLRGIPAQYHGAAVKEFGGGGAQDYINNASPSYQTSPPPPQPPPSPQKTSTSINQDIAAAQRMGLSGQEVPGMPGIPAKTPQGVNEPQQAEGEEGQQPTGRQTRPGMRYPLAEMSNDEFNDTLRQYPGATNKKLLINAREKQRDQRLKEEGLENQERRTGIEEEKLGISKEGQSLKEKQFKEGSVKGYREEMEGKRKQVLEDRDSLSLARRAMQMGDTSSWTQFFANKYGLDPLKSTASQLMNLASKEFIRGSLHGISARAQNQWIEQRFMSMFPSVGTKDDAKESIIEALERGTDVKEKEVELYDHYSDIFEKNPNKIARNVDRDLKKYISDRDDQMSYNFSRIKDKYSSPEALYSDDKPIKGEYITPEKISAFTKKYNGDKLKAQNELLKLGYRIPSAEQYLRWKQRGEQYGK